jgi:hypothetical protein
MKTSNTGKFRSMAGKTMMGLVLAAMIGSVYVLPALCEDGHNDRGRHDNGRYEQERGREHDGDRQEQRNRDNRSHGYRKRGYAPPRVIYAPPPPSGIEIFFPPIYIRP